MAVNVAVNRTVNRLSRVGECRGRVGGHEMAVSPPSSRPRLCGLSGCGRTERSDSGPTTDLPGSDMDLVGICIEAGRDTTAIFLE